MTTETSGIPLRRKPAVPTWGPGLERALFAAAIDLIDEAVVAVTADGTVGDANRSAERIFGRPRHELCGMPFVALFAPHRGQELAAVLRLAAADGRTDHLETEVARPDGMLVPVELSAVGVTGRSGSVEATAVVVRDLTEQRLVQARLAEAESRVRLGEELAGTGSWLWDVRTGAVQWSSGLHRLCGVDPLAFEGTLEAHLASVHPDDREAVGNALFEAARGARPLALSYRVMLPDGTTRWLEVRGSPTTDSAGVVVGLYGVAREAPPPADTHP